MSVEISKILFKYFGEYRRLSVFLITSVGMLLIGMLTAPVAYAVCEGQDGTGAITADQRFVLMDTKASFNFGSFSPAFVATLRDEIAGWNGTTNTRGFTINVTGALSAPLPTPVSMFFPAGTLASPETIWAAGATVIVLDLPHTATISDGSTFHSWAALTSVEAWSGASLTCPASLTLSKVSTGSVGEFTFSITNADTDIGTAGNQSGASITTAATGAAATYDADSGVGGIQQIQIVDSALPVVITESSLPTGFSLDGASCDNTTQGTTGIGTLDGTAYTIPAGTIAGADDITCTFTNEGEPTTIITPAMSVMKSAADTSATVGDTITYTYQINNTGNITLTNVTLYDDPLGMIVLPVTTLIPGESTMATATYTVMESDIGSDISNTAYVTGTSPSGDDVTDSSETVDVSTFSINDISITKIPPTGDVFVGDTITYTYVVENNGNVAVSITATDDPLGAIPLPDSIPAGESVTGTLTYLVTAADAASTITNTATVTGTTATGETVTDTTPIITVSVQGEPSINIIKTSSSDTAEVGDVITYTYTVVNDGDVPLESITVIDDKLDEITMMLDNDLLGGGTLGTVGQLNLSVGTATYVVQPSDVGPDGTGSITNVAVVTALSANGTPVSDEDTITVTTDITLGSIGDTIYNDDNGNGMQDAGESGLGGVMITITGPDGVPMETETAADGSYSFTGLMLGEYTVTVDADTLPEGKTNAVNSGNPDGNDDGTSTVTLTKDEPDDDTQDFGYLSGSIGDTIYHDENGNGMQDDGEPGLAGVEVTLTGPDGSTTITTGADGMYLFDDLPMGDYTLTVNPDTLPAAKQGADNTGDPDGTLDNMTSITLSDDPAAPNIDDLDQDFGYQLVGSIGDTIFHDENGNGMQDTGELGLSGVEVTLAGPNGSTTATTDDNGFYEFTDLPMGDYTITVNPATLPANKQGAANTADPDGEDTNMSSVTLSADGATDNPDQDFGYLLDEVLGSIGRVIYHDLDGDGVQGTDEPGLAGVEVTLSDADGNVLETTNTGLDGTYLFDELPIDTDYTVMVNVATLPGDKQGAFNSGDPDDGNDAMSAVRLDEANGINNVNQNFGFVADPILGTVGDFVYSITRDGNEPLENVLLTLTLSGSITTVYTATTNAAGMYLFTDIPLGDYTMELDDSTLPTTKQGLSPAVVFDNGDDNTVEFSLTASQPDNLFIDYGYAKPTAVTVSSMATRSYTVGLLLSWVVLMAGTAVVTRRAEN